MAGDFKFPDEVDDPIVDNLDDDEIEIEVVDDTPEKDRGRKPLDGPVEDPTEDELASYSDDVKKRISKLTHARHDERRAKEATLREKQELERFTQSLLEENKRLKQTVNVGSQQFAETARSAADSAFDMAKRQYREAYETGDPDKILEAHEKLTDAQLRAQAAKNFNPTPLQVDDYEVQQQAAAVQQPQLDEKTTSWQARNRWFGHPKHKAMTSYALGLHQELVDSGVDPRSDEYFDQIDGRLRSTFRDFFGSDEGKARSGDGSRRPNAVVAPATRSAGPKKIRLNETQMRLIKRYGLTPQQYVAEMARLEKQNG